MSSAITLLAGLGNPGPEYAATRHNAGFWLVDELARRHGATLRPLADLGGEGAKVLVDGRPLWLFKPRSYMNESGRPVAAMARFYKVAPAQLLVAHDELELPVGEVRWKLGGGHGGHNGLRDLTRHLGPEFWRCRLGIGRPQGKKTEVHEYVLTRPSREDLAWIEAGIDRALADLPKLLAGEKVPAGG